MTILEGRDECNLFKKILKTSVASTTVLKSLILEMMLAVTAESTGLAIR